MKLRLLAFVYVLALAAIVFAADASAGRSVFARVHAVPLGSAVALVLITLEECSQVFFRARSFDSLDLLADYLGVACAALAATSLRARAARSKPCGISG